MPILALALLLFWKKHKLNILIIFHLAIAMTLYTRAVTLSSLVWAGHSIYSDLFLFNAILSLSQKSVNCFLFIWLFEWWYIGRRRSELNME